MKEKNRQWRLRSRPRGMPGPEHFELGEAPRPEPAEGEFLVRTLYLSCDPAQRTWMERDTYIRAVALGEVMRSGAVGRVVASRHPHFREGDLVSGMFGWQDYAVSDGGGFIPSVALPRGVPIPTCMSVLGPTGLTAYFGMLDIGDPRAGEEVLVSGAAGATGSIAAQLAKLRGARVVGIAGGEHKCAWLTEELGLDAAIDYRKESIPEALAKHLPRGCDVFFDNVGGAILDAALARLADHARVVLCGAISVYNDLAHAPPIHNLTALLARRARVQGFLVADYADRFAAAGAELAGWVGEGRLRDQVDVSHGLESAPEALARLFRGENLGKQLVRVVADEGPAR